MADDILNVARPGRERLDAEEPDQKRQKTANASIEAVLPDDIFLNVAEFLDVKSLCNIDSSSSFLKNVIGNAADVATPWHKRGAERFHGMQVNGEIFDCPSSSSSKKRYVNWIKNTRMFKGPCPAAEGRGGITTADHVAYFSCSIRLDQAKKQGVFMEIDVSVNADNLSLAVVDFDAGGRSSVTFSPDTGAVIKEQKIQERPRKVKGWYVQPLKHIGPPEGHGEFSFSRGERFEGKIGIYVADQKIAFFRQTAKRKDDMTREFNVWESTGFIVGTDWVFGNTITPCLAFRDEGHYEVKISNVCHKPPFYPDQHQKAWTVENWRELNWDGGAHHMIEVGELPDELMQHHNNNAVPPPPTWNEVNIPEYE